MMSKNETTQEDLVKINRYFIHFIQTKEIKTLFFSNDLKQIRKK
jgi:hypothetical protein